jgi:RNA-directed DNA polymerase
MNLDYKRVKKNNWSPGIDGMKADELLFYLKQKGEQLKALLLEGKYRPQPVRRVEIPKPDGGIRLLGIPTVLDRMIQQALFIFTNRRMLNGMYGSVRGQWVN